MNDLDLIYVPCPLCGGHETRYERTLNGFTLERCGNCGFVFNNPRYTEEKLSEIYKEKIEPEKLIALYERIHTPTVFAGYDRLLDVLDELLPQRGRLLDFGSGPGYFFERAQKRGWDAHGIDLGHWCKLAADKRGVPNMHVGHLEDMKFPCSHFDVIFAKGVLEHLIAPQKILTELYQILRPVGILFIIVPNYHCLSILIGRDDFVLNTPPQHVSYFTPKTMRKLLEQCGFEKVRTGSMGGIKYVNFFGRPYRGDIVNAYDTCSMMDVCSQPVSLSQNTKSASAFSTLLKRLVHPVVKKVLYDYAKVAMTLTAICRRPA